MVPFNPLPQVASESYFSSARIRVSLSEVFLAWCRKGCNWARVVVRELRKLLVIGNGPGSLTAPAEPARFHVPCSCSTTT